MIKIFAIFIKEWKLLWRDKLGLIFLFILPMCLVLFITLTSSEDPDKPRQLEILLLNKDPNGQISKSFIAGLKNIEGFVITQLPNDQTGIENNSKNSVAQGKRQALIIIPAKISDLIEQQKMPASIQILYDPALPKNFQNQINASIQIIIQEIEIKLLQKQLNPMLPENKLDQMQIIQVNTDYVKTQNKQSSASYLQPNESQQNVPAWALFGMFFIITPLSGMIVKERRLGVMSRLYIAPVSLFNLIWGKICAFVCLNLLQLVLMLGVGVFVLPWFNLPTLNVTHHPWLILAVGISASLAATGFGMLIGSLVRTPEQANVVGPFIIVIAAAIGGILVPAYLLPEALKKLSNLSPMYWALQAFIDIFVRDATLKQLLPNIFKLLIFAFLTIALAAFKLDRYRHT